MNVFYKASLNCAGLCAVVANNLLNTLFRFLGEFLLYVLHQLYTCYLVIGSRLSSFRNVKRLLRTTFKTDIVQQTDIVKNNVLRLEKIPKHLTVIIGSESPSYKDFVKFIIWCMQAGISHISFYEHHNGIDCKALFESVCKDAKQYIPFIKWGESFSDDIKEMSKIQINGYMWKPIITVHLYRRDDGFKIFMKAVPEIINSGVDSLDVTELDAFLRKYLNAPDPDLALVCGDVLSCFGFPPWCLRVTQFQQLTSHHNVTVEAFLEQLEEFSACKQRWGK